MYKKGIITFLFFLVFSNTVLANNYVEKTLDNYKFRYIKYDLKSEDYIFKIWVNPDYWATDLRTLMEDNNWVSALNWVFFCPESYSECGWKNFTNNERYVTWFKIWTSVSTQDRVVFALDKDNNPFLYQTNKINSDKEWDIYYGFANFPLLLQDWVSKYQDYVDLWLIDYKMEAKMQRNFICSDSSWKYIFSWYVSAISLKDLPDLLIKLWCNNALNLDAGWSSAMIYNSRYIIWPGRDVLDWVIIERKWLDTKKLIEFSSKVKVLLEKKLDKVTYKDQLDFLNSFSDTLTKIRVSIYDKNSINLYDSETWKKIWYEINVKSLKSLENVYLVNYLNKIVYELKLKYSEDNDQKTDKEDLLF